MFESPFQDLYEVKLGSIKQVNEDIRLIRLHLPKTGAKVNKAYKKEKKKRKKKVHIMRAKGPVIMYIITDTLG